MTDKSTFAINDTAKLDATVPTITALAVSNDGTQISSQTEPIPTDGFAFTFMEYVGFGYGER